MAVSPVRKISASPNGKLFAVLTHQLLAGETKLQVLIQDGKFVSDIAIGTENIAVLSKQANEYVLFNLKMQKIYSYSLGAGEIVVFAQQYGRPDKVLNLSTIRDLTNLTTDDSVVSSDVRASLLSTALNSQHLESSANVLKIAEQDTEAETCRILEILNEFILLNYQTPFGLQMLGLSLGFAGRAFKKFHGCAKIFNLIFAWQDLLVLDQLDPSAYLEDVSLQSLAEKSITWNSIQVLQHSIKENILPLGQFSL